jgi:C1A family cysteine protease
VVGGHAVVVVGYDDAKKIQNTGGGPKTTGAFRIRNSWGKSWGDAGYGWLPYEYVLQGLAVDWWSLIKSSWVDTKVFGL